MQKIILIDDDQELATKLKRFFEDYSFDLNAFTNPLEAIDYLKNEKPLLVILDGMMPEMDGLDVCKKIREFSNIPIIMLSGRVEEIDKIMGLENGADDYVTKPFSPRELVARIKSQIRKLDYLSKNQDNSSLEFSDLKINENTYEVTLKNNLIPLTATEFEILKFLATYKGEVKSREEIMQALHGDTWEAFDRSLDIAISRIRKKLASIDDKEYIKTVRLKGYVFAIAD